MAKSCNQKAKILYLERMLWETGDTKALSMQEILANLEEYGIHAERKSIYDDMEALRAFGMNVQYRRGSQGGYYLAESWENEGHVREMFGKFSGSAEEAEKEPEAKENPVETATPGELLAPKATEAIALPELPPSVSKSKGKKCKLLIVNELRSKVEKVLGTDGVYKEKGTEHFTVTAHFEENRQFYGWLASMGRKVHIIKPVKTALAYRDFLKGIAKDYKGIEK